jgi:ABC-2 type transport system ATP-binding protein
MHDFFYQPQLTKSSLILMSHLDESYININDISHTYKSGTCALDNINLEIGVGLFGMLGSNGAGKSTLMKIVCTLLEATSGNVTIDGYDVVNDRRHVRNLFGYLPQEFGAWGTQSVEEVLNTLALLSGLDDAKQRKDRTTEVLESVGLRKLAGRKVKKLSGGMLRRLGVAQALIHSPKVLIMDEPTVGLDPEERLRFRQMMSDLSRDRIIVLSTHIVADLGANCSDMVLIHQGRLEFRGSPLEMITQAEGKVFEIAASPELEQNLELKDNFEIVARTFQDGKSIFRGVGFDGFRPDGATIAENITLEEAYLAFTLDKGRKIDELEIN